MKASTHARSRKFVWTLGSLAIAAMATAGYAAKTTTTAPTTGNDDLTRPLYGPAGSLSTAFERVADSIERSVVSIKSVNRVRGKQANQVLPFHHFPFGDLFSFNGQSVNPFRPNQPEFLQQGLGTGFVLREDGYLLTNNHVIKDADEVTVTLWDETTHTASVVGADPKTDLAVLRIEADDLTPVPLGDDSSLRVGSWVAAVGNPFGLSSTMTAGIVSAVGRSRVGLTDYENFIQTDAAINPGNSGGPLVNLAGEVVGVNTAIFSKSGGYMGIGFAIPINMARDIADSLIEDGHVRRGFLGVVIQDVDEGLAASFNYSGANGALVSDVHDGSPASDAELQPGDIIVDMDGNPIEDVDALRLRVASTEPGTTVAITFVRDGERETRDVRIGELDPDSETVASKANSKSLGMKLDTLTPRAAQLLGLQPNRKGALVTHVDPFGEAARAGVRLNDVVLAVGSLEIHDANEFKQAIASADLSAGVRLTVLTGSNQRFVFLRVDE